jgi:predicted GNAT family acetyltransferase
MNIEHIQENKAHGYFVATENSVKAGTISYVMSGEKKLIIEHTIVNPSYEGHGLGKKLVFAVVNYARSNNLKILPVCTFAKAVFDKTPEIQDVLF